MKSAFPQYSIVRRSRRLRLATQNLRRGVFGLFVFFIFLASILYTRVGGGARVYAVPNAELNFQARLLTAGGGIVPDSNTYSVEFNLYSVDTGGTTQ